MLAVFYLSTAVTFAFGLWFYLKGKGGSFFAALSAVQFVVALTAVISVISLYIYQMPSHHCPFCILQSEYHFVGYPIYFVILTAAITGVGAGWLSRYHGIASLREALPGLQRNLALTALVSLVLLAAISAAYTLLTSFTLR
jgi:hypothetical protein